MKKSISTVIIMILLIVVGLIFAYITIEDKKLDKRVNETVNNIKKDKKEIVEEEVNIDDEEIQNILNDFDAISGIDKYSDFRVDNLDKYRLILTAINGLEFNQITWCISSPSQINTTISIDDFNKSLNKYIKDQELTIDDIKNSKSETGLTVGEYGYDMYAISIDGENIHVIGSCDGRGPGVAREVYKRNPIKAVKKDDKLYIYMKVAYGEISKTANDLSYDYYKDNTKTEFIETIPINNDLTWEKYKTYKQIYKKYDDKYYFISSKIDE